LNYMVTSNHIHLLLTDNGDPGAISKAVQLIAGRVGQEYNQRKGRKGAFWEDRYHATAIQEGDHLIRCLVYIDLNMFRAGAVDHPEEWPHGGYREIQHPPRRSGLIDYVRLMGLEMGDVGAESSEMIRPRSADVSHHVLGLGSVRRKI
jgi:putative transposase